VVILEFPADRIVGTVDWGHPRLGAHGPTLATGQVEVPDGTAITLDVQALTGIEPAIDSWTLLVSQNPVDLGFLRQLPADAIESVSLRSIEEESFAALSHLAPGLHRLYLPWSGLGDSVLPTLAALSELTYLQTFGNHFTDAGVQVLAGLTKLESLYLEEESLSVAAFGFASRLPGLKRLGLQDVPLVDHELDELRQRLPGVDVR